MNWTWDKNQEKVITRWLSVIGTGQETDEDYEFIGNVRSGELCFDLVIRECDKNDYELFADLYVSGDGVKAGYGKSETGKIYDFFGSVGYCAKIDKFTGMDIEKFKNFIDEQLTKAITDATEENSVGCMGSCCNLLEKANKPLIVW